MQLALNTRIGRYEVRSMLGQGGMGEVYLAHDTKLDRFVALKVLPLEVASNQQRMERFIQEARATSQLLQEFSGGVFMIELGAIRQPELVASMIAQPLGGEVVGKPIIGALTDHLRERNTLLVIDNFEQVSAAGSMLAGLLAAAPRVKMLVTSRKLLNLSVEREYMVPPLAVPESLTHVSPDELTRYEAVMLFVARTRGEGEFYFDERECTQCGGNLRTVGRPAIGHR